MSPRRQVVLSLSISTLAYVAFLVALFAKVTDILIFSPVVFIAGILWAGLTAIENHWL